MYMFVLLASTPSWLHSFHVNSCFDELKNSDELMLQLFSVTVTSLFGILSTALTLWKHGNKLNLL